MHELTFCESLLDILDEERRRRRFAALRRVKLEVGRFACLDPEALVWAFGITSRGTWLEGALIEVDRPPGRVHCLDCGADAAVEDRLADCPTCGGSRLEPVGGEEARLVEMEIVG